MKHLVLGFSILALACAVLAAPFETTCDGYCVGPVKISCPEAGNWSFTATRGTAADGVETMEIALTASRPSPPPKFSVSFDFDQVDAHHKWTTRTENVTMPPNWGGHTASRLCSGMPLVAFLNDNDRNRIAVSCSEAKRTVGIDAGLLGYEMYQSNQQFFNGEGIVKGGVDQTIAAVARLGRDGMRETDREILHIMIDR